MFMAGPVRVSHAATVDKCALSAVFGHFLFAGFRPRNQRTADSSVFERVEPIRLPVEKALPESAQNSSVTTCGTAEINTQ